MTTNNKPIDLDAEFGATIADNVAKTPVHTFTFGGREWHASESASAAGALFLFDDSGELDFAAVTRYTMSFIVAEEQADFEKLLKGMRGLDVTTLAQLTDRIYQIVTSNPTELPPASPRSPAKRAGARSTARSSSTVIDVESKD